MGGDRSTRTLGPGARREGSGRSGWSVHGIFILLNPLKSENVLGSKNALLWGGVVISPRDLVPKGNVCCWRRWWWWRWTGW